MKNSKRMYKCFFISLIDLAYIWRAKYKQQIILPLLLCSLFPVIDFSLGTLPKSLYGRIQLCVHGKNLFMCKYNHLIICPRYQRNFEIYMDIIALLKQSTKTCLSTFCLFTQKNWFFVLTLLFWDTIWDKKLRSKKALN